VAPSSVAVLGFAHYRERNPGDTLPHRIVCSSGRGEPDRRFPEQERGATTAVSPNLKWTFVIGNGVLAVVTGLIALVSIGRYGVFPFVVETAVCALAVFNIRIILWAARLTSEEEWLKAEVRKAELRRRLADLGQFASASPALSAPGAGDVAADGGQGHQPPPVVPAEEPHSSG
jgi:hypothetical protein